MHLDTLRVRTEVNPRFRADVLGGLAPHSQRAIPARWLYDARGSELFEEITRLPEYYPTRTETALLERHCLDIGRLVGSGRAVVEFGSGSSTKTPILIDYINPAAYVPIDISSGILCDAAAAIEAAFPGLAVFPIEGDFSGELTIPEAVRPLPKLGFFPGSTIGNMTADAATDLLRTMRQTLGVGSALLIGMDRVKDEQTLVRAYDDAQGVTAAFNRNLLDRINRELGGDIPVSAFHHRARWNRSEARIEMHLEVDRDVAFMVDDHSFAMTAGETIHTENSHKFDLACARLLLRTGGWTPLRCWTDAEDRFAILLAEARPNCAAP